MSSLKYSLMNLHKVGHKVHGHSGPKLTHHKLVHHHLSYQPKHPLSHHLGEGLKKVFMEGEGVKHHKKHKTPLKVKGGRVAPLKYKFWINLFIIILCKYNYRFYLINYI